MKRFLKRSFFAALEKRGQHYTLVPKGVSRTCPICNYEGHFKPFGVYTVRADALCPECESLERHRFLYLYFQDETPIAAGDRVLHFAPEQAVRRFVEPMTEKYVTTDLYRDDVDHNWNIEAIDAPDESFDSLICNHVLEHVDCDKALAECRRILVPGGLGIFTVPIWEGLDTTYENPDADTDEERLRHFRQTDHVRIFGRDVRDRFPAAGLELREYVADGARAAEFGLTPGERIFLARRPEKI